MDEFFLNDVTVLPRRMVFSGIEPNTPLTRLRSVWGRALEAQNEAVYQLVFGKGDKEQRPGYALSELGMPTPTFRAIRWTVIGTPAIAHHKELWKAWGAACKMGLGKDRIPFFPAETPVVLGPSGEAISEENHIGWRLDEALWPLLGDPGDTPCRLTFPLGVSIRRKNEWDKKNRTVAPDWPRIIQSAWNKLSPWLEPHHREMAKKNLAHCLAEAAARSAAWQCKRRVGLVRWSATQQTVLQHYCDQGYLELPSGPGPAWPLLLAAYWLGLGHHTTEGMGHFTITAL